MKALGWTWGYVGKLAADISQLMEFIDTGRRCEHERIGLSK